MPTPVENDLIYNSILTILSSIQLIDNHKPIPYYIRENCRSIPYHITCDCKTEIASLETSSTILVL